METDRGNKKRGRKQQNAHNATPTRTATKKESETRDKEIQPEADQPGTTVRQPGEAAGRLY